MMALRGTFLDVLQSTQCATNCVLHVCSAATLQCVSITCNKSVPPRCSNGQFVIKFHKAEILFIFIYWLKTLANEWREKTEVSKEPQPVPEYAKCYSWKMKAPTETWTRAPALVMATCWESSCANLDANLDAPLPQNININPSPALTLIL